MSKLTNFIGAAKKALTKKKQSVDYRGLNTKKSYSSFWMDDYDNPTTKFSGLNPNATQSSDTVKLVKLSNYRRAITNFVKIVTKQDIPVGWAGNQSYTDGKSITLSSDIKDSTFDVTVGLALHESSHVILTDFKTMTAITKDTVPAINTMISKYCVPVIPGQQLLCSSSEVREFVRAMLNWIEDRRIDNYIFSTSPGYKAYYHKLYDYYWNSNDILKGFITDQFAQPGELDHWMFHIVNSINPNFNVKALPRLDEIMEVIDLKKIGRIQNSWESLDIACAVTDIVFEVASEYWTEPTKSKPKENEIGPGTPDANGTPQSGSGNSGSDMPADINEVGTDDGTGTTGEDAPDTNQPVLSPSDMRALEKALQQQKDFLRGETGKKSATQRLQKKLEQVAKQDIEVQQVGGEDGIENASALTYDLTNSGRMLSLTEAQEEYNTASKEYFDAPYGDARNEFRERMKAAEERVEEAAPSDYFGKYHNDGNIKAIQAGMEMGGLLGKKLQLHNESRERVDNRLRNGRIDNKRLAHAGYGIENVFSQIHVDKYKKANLHISLDGSGSMSGSKWESTIQMTVAIAKAASYTQNINVQVSIRVTNNSSGRNDAPVVLSIYDSRKNKINHLAAAFKAFSPTSMTPEGLCYEAMVKKNMFQASSSELDSYLLNISDGYPQCGSYTGSKASRHTAKWINKIKSIYNIKVLSFWIESSRDSSEKTAQEKYDILVSRFNNSTDGKVFRDMYGKDASVVDSTSAIMIARELNKKFMQQA